MSWIRVPFLFVIFFLVGSMSALANGRGDKRANWECGGLLPRPTLSLEDFSSLYLRSSLSELPIFIREWVQKSVDQDQDGKLTAGETERMVCRASRVMNREFKVVGGPLVKSDGRLDWDSHLTADWVVSPQEFRFELASYARDWVEELLQSEGLLDELRFLRAGEWTVSQQDLDRQVDLMVADRGSQTLLLKYLDLAFVLSELRSRSLPSFPQALGEYVRFGQQQRNFPWIVNVRQESRALQLAFNQVTRTGGEASEQISRFYILQGIPVRLQPGQAPAWGQPSEQVTFTLSRADSFPETSRVRSEIRRGIVELCRDQGAAVQWVGTMRWSSRALKARLQKMVDQLSDHFHVKRLEVVVQEAPLEGGSTAYLSRQEARIYFSWNLLSNVQEVSSEEDLQRHMQFLVLQEFIHFLQSHTAEYEQNLKFYNNPLHSYRLFGDVGYQNWYLDQPVERDAQDLAGEFAAFLGKTCSF